MRSLHFHLVPTLALLVSSLTLPMERSARGAEEQYVMTTYQFALLVDGPRRDAVTGEAAAEKQRQHLEYLVGLLNNGTALIVGPVEGAAPIRGIVVLTVETAGEAETILSRDPWVQAGHLAVEVHPWWAAEGIIRQGPDALDLDSCWLGLLRRPAAAPELDDARLRELQEGHMQNIQAMAASGDLVIAGPMGDDTDLRGVFVFRTREQAQVRALVERDPSVQAGRLRVDLMRWRVPRGALPPAGD